MNDTRKKMLYENLIPQIDAVLEGESNLISIMSTLLSMLRSVFNEFYWVGFYIEDNGLLKVGPYQGSLGCLSIDFERGVCGRAYRTATTQIVDDVNKDPEHIACDVASMSEIVIPVKNSYGNVIAVLDVDSDQPSYFNETDRIYLEKIVSVFIESQL